MFQTYKKRICNMNTIRIFLIILSGAAATAFLIFNSYDSLQTETRESIASLNAEENNILNRCGVVAEKFKLCSYPYSEYYPQIAVDETVGYASGKSLRLIFKDNDANHYLGLCFYLSLNLSPYQQNGRLEFWLRGRKDSLSVKNLYVYLKEGPAAQNMAGVSLPIKAMEKRQKLSIPLNKFFPIEKCVTNSPDKNKGFNWEIREILFAVDAVNSDESLELFIDNLRITSNDENIFELL